MLSTKKAPHYWPVVTGIPWLSVDFPDKWSVMWEPFPYHNAIVVSTRPFLDLTKCYLSSSDPDSVRVPCIQNRTRGYRANEFQRHPDTWQIWPRYCDLDKQYCNWQIKCDMNMHFANIKRHHNHERVFSHHHCINHRSRSKFFFRSISAQNEMLGM